MCFRYTRILRFFSKLWLFSLYVKQVHHLDLLYLCSSYQPCREWNPCNPKHLMKETVWGNEGERGNWWLKTFNHWVSTLHLHQVREGFIIIKFIFSDSAIYFDCKKCNKLRTCLLFLQCKSFLDTCRGQHCSWYVYRDGMIDCNVAVNGCIWRNMLNLNCAVFPSLKKAYLYG